MQIAVHVLSLLLLVDPSSGWEFCSDTNEPAVNCYPCTGRGEQYKCPRQCGRERNVKYCDTVCSHHCVTSQCEYDVTGSLQCIGGCREFFTGPYCQQMCMDGCVACNQNNTQCFRCEKGLYGNTCSQKCNHCREDECDMKGKCSKGCKPGFYGPNCDKHCERCMRCGDDVNCDVCDRDSGVCIRGCDYGYYGPACTKQCPPRCTQCQADTGECYQCEIGFKMKDGHCEDVSSVVKVMKPTTATPSIVTVNPTEKTTQREDLKTKSEELQEPQQRKTTDTDSGWTNTMTDRMSVEDSTNMETGGKNAGEDDQMPEQLVNSSTGFIVRNYLLPAIVCLMVFLACCTVLTLWRRRTRLKVLITKGKGRFPKRKGLSGSGHLYAEIPAKGQPGSKLVGPTGPSLVAPAKRPSDLDLKKWDSSSTQYMTPIEDGETPEMFIARPVTQGFESHTTAVLDTDLWMTTAPSHQNKAHPEKSELVFENEVRSRCLHDKYPIPDMFPLNIKSFKTVGSYEIPVEYLDTSHSGRSSPRIFDMSR